jgi:hypothetical protein
MRTAASSFSRSTGLVRKSTAPAFMAFTLAAMSAFPLRNTTGQGSLELASSCWSSSPFRPGIERSSTRQPDWPLRLWDRKSLEEGKVRTAKPADRSSRPSDLRTNASSSTTFTKGASLPNWPPLALATLSGYTRHITAGKQI